MQHVHLKQWSLSTKVHGITFNKVLETGLYDWECLFHLVVLVTEMQYMWLRCSHGWYFEG